MLPNRKYTPAELLKIGRKRGWLILAPSVVGLFCALVMSSRIANVYQAETLIQIVPQRVPDNLVRSTVTIRTEDRLEALGQQVLSRAPLERIIVDLDLYQKERAKRPMQDVIELMRANAEIELVRPGRNQPPDAFYLRFKYGDPVMAARVTERLGALYVEYNARERGALAEGANEFLETQLESAKSRLEAQEKKLQAFRERYAGRLPSQLQANMQAIESAQLQRQTLAESLARDRDRKLMLERLHNDAVAQPTVLRSTQGPASDPAAASTMSPEQQLEAARSLLTQLESRLKEGHPDLKRVRKQVTELQTRVSENAAKTPAGIPNGLSPEELQRRDRLNAMRAEIESLDRQIAFKEQEERELVATISDYQSRIESAPGLESEWLVLSRDYDTLQTSFRELLTKAESAKVSADLETRHVGEQFRVLDPPRPPFRPISPARHLFSAGGLLGGLFVGLAIVLLLELADSSLRTDAEVEQLLKLPVLALVPTLLTTQDKRRARRRRVLLSSAVGVVLCAGTYVAWVMQLWKFVA